MEATFRRIQGPYGKSRRYMISLPREYAERVLRRGYEGFVLMIINNIAILVPSKGYDMDSLLERAKGNYPYLEDVERVLVGEESILLRLERLADRLERSLAMLRTLPERIDRLVQPMEVEELSAPQEEVPSYLKDNPWLEILSKRGRE